LFADFSDDVLARVNVGFANFEAGDVIAHHGDSDASLVLVVSGRALSSRHSENGREVGVAFLNPGDSSGEAAILLNAPAMFTVVAVDTVLAGLMARAEARRLFAESSVSTALLRLLAGKLERVADNQVVLTLPSAYARIYSVILSALREGPDEAEAQRELPSQAAIAMAANVSRETVSRAMRILATHGAITREGRRYHLANRGVLLALAAQS
jgi:CRP-like cAMP-binding protein